MSMDSASSACCSVAFAGNDPINGFQEVVLQPILDVKRHHASIDEVVADIYEHWLPRPG